MEMAKSVSSILDQLKFQQWNEVQVEVSESSRENTVRNQLLGTRVMKKSSQKPIHNKQHLDTRQEVVQNELKPSQSGFVAPLLQVPNQQTILDDFQRSKYHQVENAVGVAQIEPPRLQRHTQSGIKCLQKLRPHLIMALNNDNESKYSNQDDLEVRRSSVQLKVSQINKETLQFNTSDRIKSQLEKDQDQKNSQYDANNDIDKQNNTLTANYQQKRKRGRPRKNPNISSPERPKPLLQRKNSETNEAIKSNNGQSNESSQQDINGESSTVIKPDTKMASSSPAAYELSSESQRAHHQVTQNRQQELHHVSSKSKSKDSSEELQSNQRGQGPVSKFSPSSSNTSNKQPLAIQSLGISNKHLKIKMNSRRKMALQQRRNSSSSSSSMSSLKSEGKAALKEPKPNNIHIKEDTSEERDHVQQSQTYENQLQIQNQTQSLQFQYSINDNGKTQLNASSVAQDNRSSYYMMHPREARGNVSVHRERLLLDQSIIPHIPQEYKYDEMIDQQLHQGYYDFNHDNYQNSFAQYPNQSLGEFGQSFLQRTPSSSSFNNYITGNSLSSYAQRPHQLGHFNGVAGSTQNQFTFTYQQNQPSMISPRPRQQSDVSLGMHPMRPGRDLDFQQLPMASQHSIVYNQDGHQNRISLVESFHSSHANGELTLLSPRMKHDNMMH